MQFTISVLATDRQTKPTAKGSYQQLEVSFKNLTTGKVESKKLMSFVKPDNAYKALNDAKAGDVYEITSEKKEGDQYWTWVDAKAQAPGGPVSTQQTTPTPFVKSAGSSYPTNEEREATQRSIVRQSSLKAAVDSFASLKTPADTEVILKRAQEFVDFVNNKPKQLNLFDQPSDDLDDVPF